MHFLINRAIYPLPPGTTEIPFIQSDALTSCGFVHAYSTRLGGVSSFPAASLNMDYKIDNGENIVENMRRFFTVLGVRDWPLFTPKQVHLNKVFVLSLGSTWNNDSIEADAIVTNLTRVLLGVRTADCLPILVGDPVKKSVGIIHAGWRGTVSRVAEKAIEAMTRELGSDPANCVAAFGPCICEDCYEVKSDVVKKFAEAFGPDNFMKWVDPGKTALADLKGANRSQLLKMGLKPENVFVSPFCTVHQNDLFFSNRREGKIDPAKVGRMLNVIGINI